MDKAGREKRNQEILESYNLGNSYFKMAETFGLSKGGVHKIIQAIKNEKPIIPQPKQETIEEVVKDLNYWKNNAEEDYLKVPISVLRYISELEKHQSEKMFSNEEVIKLFTKWNNNEYGKDGWEISIFLKWFTQHKKH